MNRLLPILILILCLYSLAKADDLKSLQIEEISVGDSLLNYYSKDEIQLSFQNASYYRDKIFAVIFLKKTSNIYDRIQVTIKPNDKKYKIFALEGIIDFNNQIEKCKKKRKSIIQDIKTLILDYERVDNDGFYEADPSKNSYSYSTWFFLKTGGFISIECTKMGNEVRKKNGWTDELSIAITTEEFESFLRSDPY